MNNAAYLYSLVMTMATTYERCGTTIKPCGFHHPLRQFPTLRVVGSSNMLMMMTVDAYNDAVLKENE